MQKIKKTVIGILVITTIVFTVIYYSTNKPSNNNLTNTKNKIIIEGTYGYNNIKLTLNTNNTCEISGFNNPINGNWYVNSNSSEMTCIDVFGQFDKYKIILYKQNLALVTWDKCSINGKWRE
ncbi:MAG: hypothetical protein JXA53_08215 [Bacteroidales bacterium]|nr:hypothetical protein [Bacteroidales bacterium]